MTQAAPLDRLIDERRDNFNALRLISAFVIIVSHYFPLRDGTDANEPFYRLSGVCNIGKIVTYICFVISGMAVTRAYLRDPRPGRYLLHRLARLLPALWIAVVFCVVVGMSLTTTSRVAFLKNKETIQFVMNAAMYPNHYSLPGVFSRFVSSDNRAVVNGSLWVIAPLFFTYLLALALGISNLLRRPLVVLALAAAALLAWEVYAIHGIPAGSRLAKYSVWIEFIPHLSFFFLCGVAAAVWEKSLLVNGWVALVALLAVGVSISLRTPATYTLITLAIPVITIYLSFVRWGWLRPLNAAGVIAYGVYLYGWPIQQLFMRVWTPDRSGVELVLYPCVLCTVLGALNWYLVESPICFATKRVPSGLPLKRG